MKEALIFRVNQISDRVVVNHYGYLKGRKTPQSWSQALLRNQARLDELFALTALIKDNGLISKKDADEVLNMIDRLDKRISQLIEEM